MSPRAIRALAAVALVDAMIAAILDFELGIPLLTGISDLLFAEGSLLLVAGGISAIASISPSWQKVSKSFDERRERRDRKITGLPATDDDEATVSRESKSRPRRVSGTSLGMLLFGLIFLVVSVALSILISAAP